LRSCQLRDSRSLTVRDAIDRNGRCARTVCGEARVSRSDLKRCGLVCSERHSKISLRRLWKSGLRRKIHHATDCDFLRDLDRDDVQTSCERVTKRYRLIGIFVAEVSRRVLLVADPKRLRLVFVNGRGRDDARDWIVSRVESGRIDEGFE